MPGTRSLASLPYQVGATDPATFLLIALALSLVVTITVWIPTRRVLRIEPVAALESD
jgi:ABC-type lipoprotein release transport system permease subunit